MDFLRFSSSERYVSRVPLSKLSFEVTVERASIMEEDARERLCTAVVPWDAKEYSPQERIDMYKKVSAALQDFSAEHGDAHLLGTGPGRAAHGAALPRGSLPTLGNPSFTALETTLSRLLASANSTPRVSAASATGAAAQAAATATAATAGAESPFSLPSEQQLVERLEASQAAFFTRPTSEDFIDPTEEDIPVDPPQPFSRLAPLILRQHRREHAPNQRMYLMWATGRVAHRPYNITTTTTTAATEEGPCASLSLASSGQERTAGGLHALESVAAPSADDALHWIGTERVMCTLMCERDPHYFTAKPSLFEDHTLMVDSTHIYLVRVVPKLTETRASSTPAVTAASTKPGHSPVVAPLTLTASRQLSLSAEDGVRRVQRQQLAVRDNAQQLLEAALQQVSDSGVTATTTGLASSALTPRPLPMTTRAVAEPAAPALLPSLMQLHTFGTVERALNVPYDTIYVRCELVPEPQTHLRAGGQSFDGAGSPHAPSRGSGPSEAQAPHASEAHVFRSQMAHAGRVMYDECLCAVDHVLNLPFQCSYTDHVLPAKPLRMNITVFTEGTGATGHQAPVAYTCAQLPVASPGRHTVEAPLWAPHKTGTEFLKSALVGGAPALVDTRQTGPVAHGTGIGVKQGMVTDNVGLIRIVVNVLHERRPHA